MNFSHIFEVHCEEVDKAARTNGTFDKIPENVLGSIVLHKARCLDQTADGGWSSFLDHSLPWPQAGDEGVRFSLTEPTLRRFPKGNQVKIQLSQRIMCEKLVWLIKAGRDGVGVLLNLRVALKGIAIDLKFPEETEATDQNAFLTYMNELQDVLDAIASISGELEPGTVDSAVVRRAYTKAKGQGQSSLFGVVTAALATSVVWQARLWFFGSFEPTPVTSDQWFFLLISWQNYDDIMAYDDIMT